MHHEPSNYTYQCFKPSELYGSSKQEAELPFEFKCKESWSCWEFMLPLILRWTCCLGGVEGGAFVPKK